MTQELEQLIEKAAGGESLTDEEKALLAENMDFLPDPNDPEQVKAIAEEIEKQVPGLFKAVSKVLANVNEKKSI